MKLPTIKLFPNKQRTRFVEHVGRALDMIKDDWAITWVETGKLPTQADCDEAEVKIRKYCKPLGIAVNSEITIFGKKVFFCIADAKGKLYGGDSDHGVEWNVYEEEVQMSERPSNNITVDRLSPATISSATIAGA